MKGYIRNTLSTANLNETLVRKDFITAQLMTDGLNVTQCRSVSHSGVVLSVEPLVCSLWSHWSAPQRADQWLHWSALCGHTGLLCVDTLVCSVDPLVCSVDPLVCSV